MSDKLKLNELTESTSANAKNAPTSSTIEESNLISKTDLIKNSKENVNQTCENDANEALDIFSENFDPRLAMYSPDFRLINKKCKVFDNFAAFEANLQKFGLYEVCSKKAHAKAAALIKKKAIDLNIDSELTARRFLPHQMPIKRCDHMKARKNRNLISQIAKFEGPLALLANCMSTDRRIRIDIRQKDGIRGHTSGYVIFFDKHWNIILSDVCETWTRRKYKYGKSNIMGDPVDCSEKLRKLGITLPSLNVKSLNRKNVEITRNLEQVFIRGEHIGLIVALNEFKQTSN